MEINMVHKRMSIEESYEGVKELNRTHPDIAMNPEEWLERVNR